MDTGREGLLLSNISRGMKIWKSLLGVASAHDDSLSTTPSKTSARTDFHLEAQQQYYFNRVHTKGVVR